MELKSQIREIKGKKTAGLREQGLVPAVLYGENIKNTSLAVQEKEFRKVFKEAGESQLINLQAGKDKYEVLIHDVACHPLTDKILHIDFYKPSAKKKVEAEAPLVFTGESLAVKDLAGVLMKEMHFVKVKALAHNLPREIEVNISSLKTFDDKITVKDLPKLKGVEFEQKETDIVVHVLEQKKEKEEPKPETMATKEGETSKEEGQAEQNKASEVK